MSVLSVPIQRGRMDECLDDARSPRWQLVDPGLRNSIVWSHLPNIAMVSCTSKMGVSENQGPQYGSPYEDHDILVFLGGPPIYGNPHIPQNETKGFPEFGTSWKTRASP